jgi:mannose-6-phosphate isomerase-like protein (cupin superfamily)
MRDTAWAHRAIEPVVLNAHAIANQVPEAFPDPGSGGTVTWKTLISQPNTATDTFTVGVAACAPGTKATCPAGCLELHRHTQAEVYHVIAGCGTVTIDGVDHPVEEGSVVFIPGNAEHGVRCEGSKELRWLYVFAADGFGEVQYRFDEPGPGKRRRAKL